MSISSRQGKLSDATAETCFGGLLCDSNQTAIAYDEHLVPRPKGIAVLADFFLLLLSFSCTE